MCCELGNWVGLATSLRARLVVRCHFRGAGERVEKRCGLSLVRALYRQKVVVHQLQDFLVAVFGKLSPYLFFSSWGLALSAVRLVLGLSWWRVALSLVLVGWWVLWCEKPRQGAPFFFWRAGLRACVVSSAFFRMIPLCHSAERCQ